MATYTPQSQKEYFVATLPHIPVADWFRHTPPANRPVAPAMPGGLTGTALTQMTTWLASAKDAAADAAVTDAAAITRRDQFKAYYLADQAWIDANHFARFAQWRHSTADALANNALTIPVSSSATATPDATNPPAAVLPRGTYPL